MIVVSDTSPLITLAKYGNLQQLNILFGDILVPPDVERELRANRTSNIVIDRFVLPVDWLRVRAPSEIFSISGLGPGEAAAISLSVEVNANALLIDEKAGRKIARQLEIPVIGTVGILVEAAERGLINLEESFHSLKATNFRFPHNGLDEILRPFHERNARP
jgi:predicted nucleic acid-binding protein